MSSDTPETPNLINTSEKPEKATIALDDEEEPLHLPVFRVTAKFFLVPIIIAIGIAGTLAFITYEMAGIQIEATPVSEEGEFGQFGGALFNGLFFTLIAGVSSILIYYLVKKRGLNAFRVILSVTFLFLGVILTIFFGWGILIIFALPEWSLYLLYAIAGITGCLLTYIFHSNKFSMRSKNTVVMIFGIYIGAFMGIIMPTWTTMMILIGISIWDIISVRRGPIKKIFQLIDKDFQDSEGEREKENSQISKEEFRNAPMDIGIGDIAFYALLASHALISTNSFIVWGTTTLGILIGAAWTLKLIRRNRILPGLPLSIFIGIGLYWLGVYINTQIQFLLFFN
ncbi:MAG: hypothetical protein RBG13Loki_1476 [Promethearchaeota archaeon CR_4]|nr:MAG: hypothetical protein RBG13Loki_1476 [Candidatus Lokiarchaeota archaeon CR_4]